MFKPVKAKSISEYIALIKEPRKSQIIELDSIIQKTVPSLKPVFASNMLGYGNFHYKTKSGREGDWPVLSLASQKNYISVYVCSVTNGKYIAEEYKDKLGKVSVGKSCIRFKKIDDINLEVLKKVLIEAAKSPGFE
jgi:hypothetical protein